MPVTVGEVIGPLLLADPFLEHRLAVEGIRLGGGALRRPTVDVMVTDRVMNRNAERL